MITICKDKYDGIIFTDNDNNVLAFITEDGEIVEQNGYKVLLSTPDDPYVFEDLAIEEEN